MSAASDSITYPPATTSGGDVNDFVQLLKPRIMFLVVFTALVGMVVVPGSINPIIGLAALIAITVGAGASGCLNMVVDSDIDAIMARTMRRPIPAGKVPRSEALTFGLVLSVGSVLVLGIVANWLSAGLLAFTIFFYVAVYSMWLKRATQQNIVIGGAAGAFPPMIGEAVVSGQIGWAGFILFMIIFLWTPPHFWALALVKSADYARAGIPMMPNVVGPAATRRQIVGYTCLLTPFALMPVFAGFGGLAYLVIASLSGVAMLGLALRVYRIDSGEEEMKAAQALFGFSILYLFLLFAVLLAENSFGLMYAVPSLHFWSIA